MRKRTTIRFVLHKIKKNLYTLKVQAHPNDILYRHRFLKRRRGEVAGAFGEELCQALIADVLDGGEGL